MLQNDAPYFFFPLSFHFNILFCFNIGCREKSTEEEESATAVQREMEEQR